MKTTNRIIIRDIDEVLVDNNDTLYNRLFGYNNDKKTARPSEA